MDEVVEVSAEPGRDISKLVHEFFFTYVIVIVVMISNYVQIAITRSVINWLCINYNDWMLILILMVMIISMVWFMMTLEVVVWVVMLVITIINYLVCSTTKSTSHRNLRLR